MKPLLYGYLRVDDDPADEELSRMERRLRRHAETEGFCYAGTFHEYQPGVYRALDELVEELRRAEARHVVVPSMEHVSRHPLLRSYLLNRLEFEAGARVVVAVGW